MNKKIIIYQVLTRLFGNRNTSRKGYGTIAENGCGKMNDFNSQINQKIKDMGVTHIWFTGLIRHATQTDYSSFGILKNNQSIVKGIAGSPYAITDYYDIDPDIAVDVNSRMKEFKELVTRVHRKRLKIIIDFVPNHVARQYHSIKKPIGVRDLGEDDNVNDGFNPQNNFYYCPGQSLNLKFHTEDEDNPYKEFPAKATGNDRFDNSPQKDDWYETIKLNYGVDYYAGRIGHFVPIPNTWNKMLDILLYWSSKGVDGFRCDMAEMVPVEFWHWATLHVKQKYPNIIFIGEVYNPNEYRNYIQNGGFDYLYDKVGMYDMLRAVIIGDAPSSAITWSWQSVDDINDKMLYFLENHDEQRIASDFFASEGNKAIPALIVSVLMRNNPFMFYAGQELGERGMDKEGFSGGDGRTTIFDYWSLDKIIRCYYSGADSLSFDEKNVYLSYKRILHIANGENAITDGFFFDLMYVNPKSWAFNPDKQYAFIRKYENEVILVIANFDTKDVCVHVRIPRHAFQFLNIPECNVVATDLLTGESQSVELKYDSTFTADLRSNNGRVYKFTI